VLGHWWLLVTACLVQGVMVHPRQLDVLLHCLHVLDVKALVCVYLPVEKSNDVAFA